MKITRQINKNFTDLLDQRFKTDLGVSVSKFVSDEANNPLIQLVSLIESQNEYQFLLRTDAFINDTVPLITDRTFTSPGTFFFWDEVQKIQVNEIVIRNITSTTGDVEALSIRRGGSSIDGIGFNSASIILVDTETSFQILGNTNVFVYPTLLRYTDNKIRMNNDNQSLIFERRSYISPGITGDPKSFQSQGNVVISSGFNRLHNLTILVNVRFRNDIVPERFRDFLN